VNNDIIYELIDLVSRQSLDDLKSLSLSCKRLRALCLSALFSRCEASFPDLNEARWIVPPTLIPYVRQLTLTCMCPDVDCVHKFRRPRPRCTTFPWLCGVLEPPPFFKTTLARMSNLSSVTLTMPWAARHGVSWSALQVILSAPTLRELSVIALTFSPIKVSPSNIFECPRRLAPLTSFKYLLCWHPDNHYPLPPHETEALSVLLQAVCGTLTSLELNAASAPLDTMEHLLWPRLHTLKLSGNRRDPQYKPYTTLFRNMPGLRELVLELHLKRTPRVGLAVPRELSPRPLVFPWPQMEHLYLPLPLPSSDDMYRQLPTSLRTLSLLQYPHYAQRHQECVRVNSIAPERPSAARVVRILQRCAVAAQLTRLEIEYIVELKPAVDPLHFVVHACPLLEELKLLRYRIQPPQDLELIRGRPDLEEQFGSSRKWKQPHELAVRRFHASVP
ncbi:uncharacterized protein BXZ73DRAFT_52741, partial [Epithele typhae]|uniref:uncharacterized protein n=1 Tax=Epithele typhae TaxID=378194 RepID=UPI002007C044